MSVEKGMWGIATRALIWAGGVAVFILLSCGEPLGPRLTLWREVAAFPGESDPGCIVEGKRGEVWCADISKPVISRYSGGEIEEVFTGPYEGGGFGGVNCSASYVWAAGYKEITRGVMSPYLVRYDGTAWEEIETPPSYQDLRFTGVFPVGDEFCWLPTADGVYSYEAGEWREHFSFNAPRKFYFTATPSGRAYLYMEGPVLQPSATIYITNDRGATWAEETPKLGTEAFSLPSANIIGFGTWGEQVCWATSLGLDYTPENGNVDQARYKAVILRDAAASGHGSYDIAFMAPHGPYFSSIRDIAFRGDGTGFVVGNETSVALENGEWIMEELPTSGTPYFKAVIAGASSYWAVASGGRQGPLLLYEAR